MNIIEQTQEHIMSTYGRSAVVLKQGSGAVCEDAEQKRYIDFGSGIGTTSLGFCDEEWADAVCAQVRTLQHTSNLFYHAPQAELAAKLCELTGY
ncbi:MAG: aminotransferase class III-fold pyridoxal phosphate-dependent enzyme, partial [Oscillospiraceae bacterium]|nr:aminotransferase class III-fold pyridoxal phosphate-dependent enzyme [Oscillospiraceae bacterium]